MVDYFFDSYAVIELIKGNPNYTKYTMCNVNITIFNLTEIYWSALNDLGEEKAEEIYNKFRECIMELSDHIIKEAIKFRKNNKNKDLSYADCIGYICSLKNNMVFLTGDKEFEYMENVEFVKK